MVRVLPILLLAGTTTCGDEKPIEIEWPEANAHLPPQRPLLSDQLDSLAIVKIIANVRSDGSVSSVRLSDDWTAPQELTSLLVPSALEKVRHLKFKPFLKNGHPTAALASVMVCFQSAGVWSPTHVGFPEIQDPLKTTIRLIDKDAYNRIHDEIVIHGDGTVLVSDDLETSTPKSKTRHLESQEISQLLTAFRDVDFFSLRESYRGGFDVHQVEITLDIDGRQKKVWEASGSWSGMPPGVSDIEAAIDHAADLAKWRRTVDCP
jgi:hypothetical protein